jgi:hypothetical protein
MNSAREAASDPNDDETDSNAETGHAVTVEEAMDEVTEEEGFSDESAYTPPETATRKDRQGKLS